MKKGFTLIELLVVSTIIATLIGIASVSYVNTTKSARDAKRETDLEQIRQALETYRGENSIYPAAASWTTTLTSGGYISVIPVDPKTQQDYTYTQPISTTTYSLCADIELPSATTHCVTEP